MRSFIAFFIVIFLTGCVAPQTQEPRYRTLVMGDSMFAWNAISHRGVSAYLRRGLGQPVTDQSRSGAMMLASTGIPTQFDGAKWDLVVVNGGANDLIFGCNCSARCAPVLNRIISADGTSGVLPSLLTKIRATGAKVTYAGYHRARQMNAPMRHCGDDLDELDRRVALFADRTLGVQFTNLQDVFPPGDTSFYWLDRTHPSAKGSKAIAQAILRDLR